MRLGQKNEETRGIGKQRLQDRAKRKKARRTLVVLKNPHGREGGEEDGGRGEGGSGHKSPIVQVPINEIRL